MSVAYAPRPPFTDANCGPVACGWGEINVGQWLRDGGGTIVVPDDERLVIFTLDGYPPLMRVAVPRGA